MIKSLAIKGGMLVAAILLVLWIGWPAPHDSAPIGDVQTVEGERQETVVQREERAAVSRQPSPTTAAVSTAAQAHPPQGKLDPNRATAEELQALPGIGPVLAQRVIEQRTTHGPFHTVDDLRDVKGIGKKRMDQLRPLIMVDQVSKAETKRDASLKPKAL